MFVLRCQADFLRMSRTIPPGRIRRKRPTLRAIDALRGHRRGELAPAAGYFTAGPPGVGSVVCGSGREGSSPDVLVRGFQPSRSTVTSTALRPKASAS